MCKKIFGKSFGRLKINTDPQVCLKIKILRLTSAYLLIICIALSNNPLTDLWYS